MAKPIKLTVVGDGMVGKTCMLVTYTKREFPTEYVPTVFENYAQDIMVDNMEYNMKIWDTAGQEDYERLRPLSYPETKCFLICFSVDSKTSYDNVSSKWAPEVRYHMSGVPILLVGTKADLRDDPSIVTLPESAGKKLKRKIRAEGYLECSAKARTGLDEIFIEAVRIGSATKKNKNGGSCCLF